MHTLGYAHCDVKPNNVLVDEDLHTVLCDLTRATHINVVSDGPTTRLFSDPCDEHQPRVPVTNQQRDVTCFVWTLASLLRVDIAASSDRTVRVHDAVKNAFPFLAPFVTAALSIDPKVRPCMADFIRLVNATFPSCQTQVEETWRIRARHEGRSTSATWQHALCTWAKLKVLVNPLSTDFTNPLSIANYYKPQSCFHLARATRSINDRIVTNEERVHVAVALLCDKNGVSPQISTPTMTIVKDLGVDARSGLTTVLCKWDDSPAIRELRGIQAFYGPKVIVLVELDAVPNAGAFFEVRVWAQNLHETAHHRAAARGPSPEKRSDESHDVGDAEELSYFGKLIDFSLPQNLELADWDAILTRLKTQTFFDESTKDLLAKVISRSASTMRGACAADYDCECVTHPHSPQPVTLFSEPASPVATAQARRKTVAFVL